jgi:hypothetical protein
MYRSSADLGVAKSTSQATSTLLTGTKIHQLYGAATVLHELAYPSACRSQGRHANACGANVCDVLGVQPWLFAVLDLLYRILHEGCKTRGHFACRCLHHSSMRCRCHPDDSPHKRALANPTARRRSLTRLAVRCRSWSSCTLASSSPFNSRQILRRRHTAGHRVEPPIVKMAPRSTARCSSTRALGMRRLQSDTQALRRLRREFNFESRSHLQMHKYRSSSDGHT